MRSISPLDRFEKAASVNTLIVREKGHGHYTELGNQLLMETVFDRPAHSDWLDRCRMPVNVRASGP